MNNDLQRIAQALVDDIIKYQKMGGDMNNLTPANVYNLINGYEPKDDLSPLIEIEKELLSASDDELEIHHIKIKNLIDAKTYNLLFRIIMCPNKEYSKLTHKQKIRFIKEGYKKCILNNIEINKPIVINEDNSNTVIKQL